MEIRPFAPIALAGWLLWIMLATAQGTIDNNSAGLPLDLNGSNFTYPYPVKLYKFSSQREQLEMAFMDVPPTGTSNNKTAVLLHGKNFCGATWEGTARNLSAAGYRVVLPDQVGFCKSTKPEKYQFSLHQLALNTNSLLRTLGVFNATVIGHSMGGMMAARYALMYSHNVTDLVLVDPLGLEDWKALGVPYQAIETTWTSESASNYTTIRSYEQSTYYAGNWSEKYDTWVNMLVNIYKGSKGPQFAYNQAQTTDMVYAQPVLYEFRHIRARTLIIIGNKDTTAIGKQWSPPEVQSKLGHYEILGKQAAAAINQSTLLEFADLGHAPQIQSPGRFHTALLTWLNLNGTRAEENETGATDG